MPNADQGRNQPPILQLNPADPLVVATRDLKVGEEIGLGDLRPVETIGRGHKMATKSIADGEPVRKLGQVIGVATKPIQPGQHIHTHNVEFRPSTADHAIGSGRTNMPVIAEDKAATFMGILRPDGTVATRNYIGVLTTVNCSATVARQISDWFRMHPEELAPYPNVDGVVALTHKDGCAGGADSEGTQLLRRTIGGYAKHANFGAVVMIGLGCESNQLPRLVTEEGLQAGQRIQTLVMQEVGGTRKTIEAAVARIRELLPVVNDVKRARVPAKHLVLGMQCGGSDGFSAITANPALGVAADLLVQNGGTAILSETPEIYGAEHMLLSRAVSKEVGEKLLDLLKWWEKYAADNDGSLDNNPSPGNKAGGLTTILEKSLGAAAKGGHSDLVDVLRYAEPVTKRGFVFMDTPGYDPVSATGQVAGGANLVGLHHRARLLLRLQALAQHQARDQHADVQAHVRRHGHQLRRDPRRRRQRRGDGPADLRSAAGDRVGQASKSEELGYGEDEFAPWHLGATF